jgi:hypothetical protein
MPAKMPAAKAPAIPARKGELAFTLAGKPATLRASLRAAQMVNDGCGGFIGALEGLSRFNINTFTIVLGAGLGAKDQPALDKVGEQVFATGLADLSGPATKFVQMLMNGGREPGEKADAAPKGEAAAEGNAD